MKVYHYAKLSDLSSIKPIDTKEKRNIGLKSTYRIGEIGATFALLEPLPKSWTENPHFKNIFSILKRNIGKVLLEIETDGQDAFVIDRGHMEGFLYSGQHNEGTPEEYLHETKKEAEKQYIESKIPLAEYIQKSEKLNYSLPEVIITKPISVDKINISKQQPLLNKDLRELEKSKKNPKATEVHKWLKNAIRTIKENPALAEIIGEERLAELDS